ncbi:MAG: sigma-70 family RNA polymerase sigma factor, partial [Planctomycetes bacterium]|nr:sigma-70 family RNA polymerase sigma factor [Planctomycetota bacterium]
DADQKASIATQLADPLGPAPDALMQQGEDADRLQQALGELPGAEREVILLRHFSGMSFAEVAEAMGTPLGTALARSHRGLGKLRALLEGAG